MTRQDYIYHLDTLRKGIIEQAEITFPEDEPEQKPAKRKAGAK